MQMTREGLRIRLMRRVSCVMNYSVLSGMDEYPHANSKKECSRLLKLPIELRKINVVSMGMPV